MFRSIGLAIATGIGLCIALGSAARAAETDVAGIANLNRRGTARRAVIWLDGPQKAAPLPPTVIDQRQRTFLPHVCVVTVGTTVLFPNNDSVFHNVFAYFDAKKFDLGMYPRGETKRKTMDKPGLVALLCNVHSEMSAYIMVVDTPYYALTDRNGRFTIPHVAPGAYTLHAWHESGETLTQPLTVRSAAVGLSLTLSRR